MTAHGESLGRFVDMAHQGGAFKVNSGIRFMHCPTPPVCPRQHGSLNAEILAKSPISPINHTVCR
jgi:hypothetical protein